MRIVLIGNPNCGKTTFFNALTGSNQRIGNWPGVTVEKKTGTYNWQNHPVEVTDLPGIYSLNRSKNLSQDEEIAACAITSLEADIFINVIDGCNLERHLYLTSQLLELGKPVIVVLTMMDIAKQRGISIDNQALSSFLKCPVLSIQAPKKIGIELINEAILKTSWTSCPLELDLPEAILGLVENLKIQLEEKHVEPALASYYAKRMLEGDEVACSNFFDGHLNAHLPPDLDLIIADARYQKIHDIVVAVQKKQSDASEHFTAKLDKLILNRYLAIPIFLISMYLMFLFAINIGGAFQDFFDITTDTIFVKGFGSLLQQLPVPNWLIAILANGLGKGINTTLTFIPVIAAMFFFLSFLEASGYMARAAFVVDKIMRFLGLPGKAFVPMIVGFGCNVPAIMAARTLDSERDRLITIVMSPFMSCSARLAIYAVFVAAFFPSGGQNVVFSLYLLGIIMAVFTGYILQKTFLKGDPSPVILELPAYHWPSIKRLFKDTGYRLRHFVIRAGRLIIPVCILLGALNALTFSGQISKIDAGSDTLLSIFGQWLTPLFSPMGLHQNNWPATVGLLTGMLAKEVVVGSLNSLYAQMATLSPLNSIPFDFWLSIKSAFWTIPQNLSQLGSAFLNPILASVPTGGISHSAYGMMVNRFDGKIAAYAYLVFVLLYIPCVSTMAVIRQEVNRRYMWFSIIWSFLVAYSTAVLIYQIGSFTEHPTQSLCWVLGILGFFSLGFGYLAYRKGPIHAI